MSEKAVRFFSSSYIFLVQTANGVTLALPVSVQTNAKLQPELLPDSEHCVRTARLGFAAPSRHVCRRVFQAGNNVCLERGPCWRICVLSERRCWNMRRHRNLQQKHRWCSQLEHTPIEPSFSNPETKITTEDCRRVSVRMSIRATRRENKSLKDFFFSNLKF